MRRSFLARFRRHEGGSIAVEFALVSIFFMLPLLAGGGDFLLILLSRSQLNTALQALYYYAETNPGSATDTTYLTDIINSMNTASVTQLSMPAELASGAANPSYSYYCFTSSSTAPSFTGPYTSASSCGTGTTTQTFVNYKLSATTHLPVPLPGSGSSYTLSVTGSIQTASTQN